MSGGINRLLAIDPGSTESGWVLIDTHTRKPLEFGKTENEVLLNRLHDDLRIFPDFAVVEMVASYGMAVGAEVFDTCVWIGRFVEALDQLAVGVERVKRQPVKLHHTHSPKAKDSNIRQALVDRFAYGVPNGGKGSKAEPGFFYGFKADVWQAYALAVYAADKIEAGEEL